MDAKTLVNLTLDFWKYKLNHNACTMEEIESLSKAMQKELNVLGTAEDFAKFCEQSENNVRKVINRKVVDKPKRRVYYKFLSFIKNIPDKWLNDK